MDYELERGKGGLSGEGEWHSYGQETACEKFPAWRGEDDIHSDGKLLAKSFLSGVGKMMFIAMGNCLRKVSCPARGNGIHLDGKLFFLVLQ